MIPHQAKPRRRLQFSILRLLMVVTALCVLLAIPGSLVMLAAVTSWVLVILFVLGALLMLQSPLYFLYRNLKRNAADEETIADGND